MRGELQGFNVRVYGILIHNHRVLISEETHLDRMIRKFPGGGVELGEGFDEALCREFREEMAREVVVGDFFHVSRKFHPSYFRPLQLVSLFWNVTEVSKEPFPGHSEPQPLREKGHHYRLIWRDLNDFKANEMTTPLDQEVAEKLLSVYA